MKTMLFYLLIWVIPNLIVLALMMKASEDGAPLDQRGRRSPQTI
jgi:hypothetical protein